ncbi:hypothetical protein LM599_07120 [Candidatus Acetothermia bacterium]|nr:hypothetical protein [Candidatus Acetothermia bacterium]MCI2428229.1 hypothetical protein [Candidatus Acetothermia bacterium]
MAIIPLITKLHVHEGQEAVLQMISNQATKIRLQNKPPASDLLDRCAEWRLQFFLEWINLKSIVLVVMVQDK